MKQVRTHVLDRYQGKKKFKNIFFHFSGSSVSASEKSLAIRILARLIEWIYLQVSLPLIPISFARETDRQMGILSLPGKAVFFPFLFFCISARYTVSFFILVGLLKCSSHSASFLRLYLPLLACRR